MFHGTTIVHKPESTVSGAHPYHFLIEELPALSEAIDRISAFNDVRHAYAMSNAGQKPSCRP